MGQGDFDWTAPPEPLVLDEVLDEEQHYWKPPTQLQLPTVAARATLRPADLQLAPVPVGQTVPKGKQQSKKAGRESPKPVSVVQPTVPVIIACVVPSSW